MTLTKKLALGVLSLLLLVFIGTYISTMSGARTYFFQQLESNSQDTATSLGLSLSQALANDDKASMLAMVQAVFDRGYFSAIEIKDLKGKILVSRYASAERIDIPHWFIHLVRWPTVSQSALVMKGWSQKGEVRVVSNPNYIYKVLWKNAIDLILWYLLFALLSLISVYLFIQQILRPLNRLKAQALAIQSHEFHIETRIPKTPELKSVTLAMNQMVLKVKNLFEEQADQIQLLRKEIYQDPLTGLKNRRFFLQQLNGLLTDETAYFPGLMMIVSLDGLDQYNKTNGYQAGDHMILEIAKLCEEYVTRLSAICTARINGSNFGLLLRETNSENLQKSCKELETAFIRLIQGEDHLQIYFAAASYNMHQTPRTLLEKVDGLLNEARQRGGFSGHSLSFDNSDDLHIEKQNLLEALNSNRFVLYSQRVTDGAVDFHEEILIRMLGDKSETIQNAGFFMPTAERLGLAHLIDQFVLKELSTHLFMENETVVAVNISKDTLVNKEHCDAYFEQLAKMPQELRTFIQTEVNEQLVLNHFDLASTFFEKIKKLGMKSGIDCVGLHLESMHYLLDLPITYLKLHGSLLQDISDNQKELFSINYFSKMAKTLDLEVIATQVEEKTQWEIIQALPIRWGQGMYLATSQPYSPSVDSNDPTTPS